MPHKNLHTILLFLCSCFFQIAVAQQHPIQKQQGTYAVKQVNFQIAEILVDPSNGDILLVGKGGAPIVELSGGEDYIITDSGDPKAKPPVLPKKYHVDEQGNVTELGPQAEGGTTTVENTTGVNSKGEATNITAQGVTVTFTQLPTATLPTGFDAYSPSQPQTKDLYKKLGSAYYMPYKAVAKGTVEFIVANFKITNDSIKPQDIIFKTKDGVGLKKVDSTSTSYTLKLKGTLSDADIETQALVKQGDKYQIAGAFMQYQIAIKEVVVVLVNTSKANTSAITKKLKAIYQQAAVSLNISVINDFTATLNSLTPDGTIKSGESGFAAQYTEQQRSINKALKEHGNFNPEAYYLILTDKQPSTAGEKGLMPLGRQFGYIFTANSPPSGAGGITVAHELAHGAFQLKHPFSSHSYKYATGSTNWLLDYNKGEHLPYVHWKAIHNPKLRIGVFDGDSEGELSKRVFLTANWQPFTFVNNSITYSSISSVPNATNIPQGAVRGINFKGKEYVANGNDYVFGGEKLPIKLVDLSDESKKVYWFHYIAPCNNKLYQTTWKEAKKHKGKKIDSTSKIITKTIAVNCKEKPKGNKCKQFTYYDSILETHQNAVNEKFALLYSEINDSATEYPPNREIKHFGFIGNNSLLEASKLQVYEDKLRLLQYHTGNKVLVIFLKTGTNTLYNDVQLQTMAKTAIDKAGVINTGLILVSRSYEQNFLFTDYTTDCYNSSGYGNGELESVSFNFKEKESFNSDFLNFYKEIPKPVQLQFVIFNASGEIKSIYKANNTHVKGYPFINHLVLLKSPSFDAVKRIEAKRPNPFKSVKTGDGYGIILRPEYIEKYRIWKEGYEQELKKAIENDRLAFVNKSENYYLPVDNNPVNLREPYIASVKKAGLEHIGISYAKFHFDKYKSDFLSNYMANVKFADGQYFALTNEHLYKVVDEKQLVYDKIDVASLMLAPTGLDFIPDAIGIIYAIKERDYVEASMYGVSVVAVGVTQYGVFALKSAKRFKIISHTDNSKIITHFSIHDPNYIVDLSKGEKHFSSSMSANLDEAKQWARVDGLPLEKIDNLLNFLSDLPISFTDELKKALKTDINSGLRILFDGKSPAQKLELAESWKVLHKFNPKSFVKTDPIKIEKFSKLNKSNQNLIKRLTDVDGKSTLSKFIDDCDEEFLNLLNKEENIVYVKGITSHKGANLSIDEFDIIGEVLRRNEDTKLSNWIKRSKNIERFQHYSAEGRKLGENIVTLINDKSNPSFIAKLTNSIGIKRLEDYQVLTEIPLITKNGFMKADIVLIKRSKSTNEIIDVIIIENKLSQKTGFTIRQKEGFGAIINGQTEMKLKYTKLEFDLNENDILKVSNQKIFKIADHGSANDIDNLTIELI